MRGAVQAWHHFTDVKGDCPFQVGACKGLRCMLWADIGKGLGYCGLAPVEQHLGIKIPKEYEKKYDSGEADG